MYAQQQPNPEGGAGPQAEPAAGQSEDSNVVDAEFEEVKDKKKSA